MCSQNAGNAISETQLQPPPPQLTCACGTLLTPSAITYYAGGRARRATTEESLKNALDYDSRLVHHLQENHLAYVSLYKK
jgi:hypothetical protein